MACIDSQSCSFLLISTYRGSRYSFIRGGLLCLLVVCSFVFHAVLGGDCANFACDNGKCVDGMGCVCFEGWQGASCQYSGRKLSRGSEEGITVVAARCAAQSDCAKCVQTSLECVWCGTTCVHVDGTCVDEGDDSDSQRPAAPRRRRHLRVRGTPPSDTNVADDVIGSSNGTPRWDMSAYGHVHVSANVTVGTAVTSVKASSGLEGNPMVFYQIMPGPTAQTNKFHTFYLHQRPEPDNGDIWADIKVNHPLNNAQVKEYNLTIRVENNGAQQKASDVTLLIVVDDADKGRTKIEKRRQRTIGAFPGNQLN